MIIHLYAQCWNDEWMLPFFFRHYDPWVDRYIIYDDGSLDATASILAAHPRVETRAAVRQVASSFALSEKALSDECWKESQGHADWVVVTDIDEHLFHPAPRQYLSACRRAGVTLVPALGFQMIADETPEREDILAIRYSRGAPWAQMMKASIFDPDAISEIDFSIGRHSAAPIGRVVAPARDEMLLLHYKYLGFERTAERHRQLRTGLGTLDAERGWGHKYSWSEKQLREDWDDVTRRAVDIHAATKDPRWRYPFEPWWNKYRRSAVVGEHFGDH